MKKPLDKKALRRKIIKKPITKNKKEQVLVVAQEIRFARLLSGNEKKIRDRVLKTFKKWLLNCFDKNYEFKEDDFIRVWKGLFYAVWMSDKPLVQEELCESISNIIDLFPPEQLRHAVLMMKAGFKILAIEWYGIDQHRMDKFLMLVRRYLRGSLRCLQRCGWSDDSCRQFSEMLSGADGILSVQTPPYARNATSMILHFIDCYLEEIAKVSDGNIPTSSMAELTKPLCAYICEGQNPTVCVAARRFLTALVRQSDIGIEYQDKTEAWQRMGCPEGGPDALEIDENESGDEGSENGDVGGEDGDSGSEMNSIQSKALDPRAGRVDVILNSVPVPCKEIVEMLKTMIAKARSKAHRRARICLERFEQLSANEYPLKVRAPSPIPAIKQNPSHAARSLKALEAKIKMDSDELALRGLSRKHRKRLLAKSRAGQSIVEEVEALQANKQTHKEKKPDTLTAKEKSSEDTGDKENNKNKQNKKRKHKDKQTDESPNKKRKAVIENKIINKTKNKQKEKVKNSVKPSQGETGEDTKIKTKKPEVKVENDRVESKVNIKKDTKPTNVEKASESPKPSQSETDENTKIKTKKPEVKVENDKIESKVNIKKDTKPTNGKKASESPNKKLTNGDTPKGLKLIFKEKAIKDNNLVKSKTASPKIVFAKKTANTDKKLDKNLSLPLNTPKKVKFVLKNNSMQETIDYYKSVKRSPSIPFDGTKKPSKTNLKISTPSPINPFFKKKLKMSRKSF